MYGIKDGLQRLLNNTESYCDVVYIARSKQFCDIYKIGKSQDPATRIYHVASHSRYTEFIGTQGLSLVAVIHTNNTNPHNVEMAIHNCLRFLSHNNSSHVKDIYTEIFQFNNDILEELLDALSQINNFNVERL